MASTTTTATTTSTTATGGTSNGNGSKARKYGVLYYKRKKKVHKNKGVSRLDGILIVEPPPSCVVTLTEEDDANASDTEEDDDDDDDTNGGRSYGKKGKKKRGMQKKKSSTLSSGINWTISKRAFGIQEDADRGGVARTIAGGKNEFQLGPNGLHEGDIVELTAWECEITSVIDGRDGGAASTASKMAAPGISRMGGVKSTLKSTAGGMGMVGLRRPAQPLASRKRPLGFGGGIAGSGLASRSTLAGSSSSISRGRIGTLGGGSGAARSNPLANRRPPPQPKPSAAADESTDGSDNDIDDKDGGNMSGLGMENKTESKVNVLKKSFGGGAAASASSSSSSSSSLLGGGKKRRLVRGFGSKSSAATGAGAAAAAAAAAADSFSGAIGTIIAPASIRGILRPHQREGVTFLWNCLTGASPALNQVAEESGAGPKAARGAILADDMGLGKTLMTITTLFALHRRNRDHRFIVVCPSSLVSNWAKEFDKWISQASQPKRVVIRRGGEEGQRLIKSFVPVKPNMAEILIVSYELFRMNISELRKADQIGLLVVDEGHRLKNTAGSQTLSALNALRCEARLLITGTPIQNQLSEFFNIVNFVCPGILSDLSTFRRTYERPINASNNRAASADQRAKGRSLSRALDRVTSTFVIRRLQRDVLKDHLPPRSEILLFCHPSERQKEEYIAMTRGAKGGAGPSSAGVSADALTLLTKVRKLCSHPYLLDDKNDEDRFATKPGDPMIDSGDDGDISSGVCEHVVLSGKLSILESLLTSIRSEAPTDKVVVISNFTSALSVIERAVLQRKGWSSIRLDGTTEQNTRQSLVDSFNRGSVNQSFVFLLSSKAGGCGLNLIGANRLVMFDPDWNPATDAQAMARVYRQGQKKPCYIYRMFTSGTVEEVVYQRQTQKSNLATLTVDGQGSSKKSAGFTKEELRDCFTLKVGCPCDTKGKLGGKWDSYDGVESLQAKGCTDVPLLAIADECKDVLGFVRIVPEDDATKPKDDSDAQESSSKKEEEEESSDEEAEFDMPASSRPNRTTKPKTGFLDDASFVDEDDFSSEEEFEG